MLRVFNGTFRVEDPLPPCVAHLFNFEDGVCILFAQDVDLFPAFERRIKECALKQAGMIGYDLFINQAVPVFISFQANFWRDIKDEQATQVAEAARYGA